MFILWSVNIKRMVQETGPSIMVPVIPVNDLSKVKKVFSKIIIIFLCLEQKTRTEYEVSFRHL